MDPVADGRFADRLRQVVIVADNSLIIEAIHGGLRRSGGFHPIARATGRNVSAHMLVAARPDVILIDDMNRSEHVPRLIREVKALDDRIAVIVVTLPLDRDWLTDLFDAGATAAISKAVQPAVLTTLVRETLNGHIVHPVAAPRIAARPSPVGTAEGQGLTGRELEILHLVAAGATNGEVARGLWVTEATVKFHLRNIYRKLDVANRTEASHFAHVSGLVGGRSSEPAAAAASTGARQAVEAR